MSLEKNLEKLKAHAEEILETVVKKDNITAAELELGEKAVCTLNTINKLKNADMMIDNGYSGTSYRTPYMHEASYMRGRDPETGRYMSRDAGNSANMNNRSYDNGYSSRRSYDGYSGHSKREGMIETLNEMLATAQNEPEREYIRSWLRRAETNY